MTGKSPRRAGRMRLLRSHPPLEGGLLWVQALQEARGSKSPAAATASPGTPARHRFARQASATAPCWRFHARRFHGGTARTMPSRPLSADTKAVVEPQTRLDVEAMNIAQGRIEITVAASKSPEIRVAATYFS
jgi:hypothetical protein